MQRRGILCIGSVMVDVLCPVSALPKTGEGAVAEGARMTLGGCAFNTANAARQAGGDSFLFAPVGCGPFASFARGQLGARGMRAFDVPGAGAAAGENGEAARGNGNVYDNGAAICLIEPDGERTMITLPGIERRFEPGWFEGLDTEGFGYAEVCGYEIDGAGGDAIIDFLEEHRELQLFFAPGPPIARIDERKMARIMALHAVWHLNDAELRAYSGIADEREAALSLSRETCNAVVVTAGARGASVYSAVPCGEADAGGCCVHVASQAVQPVDTVGAGDAHLGALLARRAQGDGWEDALGYANRVAALVCGVAGPTLSDAAFERGMVR